MNLSIVFTLILVSEIPSLAAGSPQQPPLFPSNSLHVTSVSQLEALDSPTLGGAPNHPRRMIPLALDLVKDFEEWAPQAYNDASGYCTLGYGHLIARKGCADSRELLGIYAQPLTITLGLALLDSDTIRARAAVQQYAHARLTDEQFGALSSFVFNIGVRNLQTSTLLRFVNEGKFDLAARQFPRWVSSGGKVLPGLANRRSCEIALFRGRLSYRDDGTFNRSDCQTLGGVPLGGSLIDISVGER